jgi:gliding motility-associated-like protein
VIELTQEITIAPGIKADFEINPGLGGCSPYEVQFVNNSNIGTETSYSWDFGNGEESTEETPSTIFVATTLSSYDVILSVSDPESCNLIDTSTLQIEVSPEIIASIPGDTALCDGEVYSIDAGNPGNDFLWEPGGESTQSIDISESNTYSVLISNKYCVDSATIDVVVHQHNGLIYGAEGCPDPPLVLSISENGSDYIWNTGENTSEIEVSESGIYWGKYLDINNCVRVDTIEVTIIDQTDQLFTPNTFTPNGDGTNDTWKAYGGSENEFEVKIFDRWGKLLWESKDINDSWDGTYKGNPLPIGNYIYKIYFYSECHNKTIENTGTIMIIK